MKKTLLIIIVFLFSASIFAQSGIQFPKHDTTSVEKHYPYVLPIWGQKLTDRNIDFQLPFGLNMNYVYNQMTLELTQFSMNFYDGENLDDIINPESLNFTETVATTSGINVRADAWVLPFMNVYGLYSKNAGTTKVSFQPQVVETGLGPNANLMEIRTLENPIDVPAVSFSTNTFGVGSTLVYGWDNYFISFDGNVSWSSSDLIEETVTFFVGSGRLGRRITFDSGIKIAFYFGAMYRNFLDQEVNTGSLGVPELDEAMLKTVDSFIDINDSQITYWENVPDNIPGKQEKLDGLYARDAKLNHAKGRIENSDAVNYSIKKEITNNWSTQIGFNLEINPNWMYRGEVGYRSGQRFFMTGLQYRFGL